jgi:hypothetical protein
VEEAAGSYSCGVGALNKSIRHSIPEKLLGNQLDFLSFSAIMILFVFIHVTVQ